MLVGDSTMGAVNEDNILEDSYDRVGAAKRLVPERSKEMARRLMYRARSIRLAARLIEGGVFRGVFSELERKAASERR